MQPSARIEALVLLIDKVRSDGLPPDRVLRDWTKNNRYAGSKDRRAIRDLMFGVIRDWGSLTFHLGEAATARTICALHLQRQEQTLEELFTGEKFAPSPLTDDEQTALAQADQGETSLAAKRNFPQWIYDRLLSDWGEEGDEISLSLNQPADVDIRANLSAGSRLELVLALRQDNVEATILDLVPTGLRLKDRVRVEQLKAYKSGLFEVQDAGSQLAVWLAGHGLRGDVLDLCAGAGGKTLALADMRMSSDFRLIAADIDASRLDRMTGRLKRSGVSGVSRVDLKPGAPDTWNESFDLVLVDAPCSGSGTWRRDPMAAWRLSEDQLGEYVTTQKTLLDQAAGYVKPGGRLAYITCSLFSAENNDQINSFLERFPDFVTTIPALALAESGLSEQDFEQGTLSLSPHKPLTGQKIVTDGFYLAVMERRIKE